MYHVKRFILWSVFIRLRLSKWLDHALCSDPQLCKHGIVWQVMSSRVHVKSTTNHDPNDLHTTWCQGLWQLAMLTNWTVIQCSLTQLQNHNMEKFRLYTHNMQQMFCNVCLWQQHRRQYHPRFLSMAAVPTFHLGCLIIILRHFQGESPHPDNNWDSRQPALWTGQEQHQRSSEWPL